jgi:hypothetical protein
MTMEFGQVLQSLHAQKRARRPHWAPDTFIYLVPGSKFEVSRAPLNVIYAQGTQIEYQPHIDIAYGGGACGVWPMPQQDVLAEDWLILETLMEKPE